MNNINTEAKNEVRELLGELVVSPVTSDVKSKISNIEESLYTLNEEQNKGVIGLKTLITREKKKMAEEIINKIDGVSDRLEDNSKLIKRKTDLLEKIQSESKENYQTVRDTINNIESLIGKVGGSLSDAISAHSESLAQISADEKKALETLCHKLDNSTQRVINLENLCHSTFSGISEAIKTCQSETIDNVNNLAKSIKADVKSISSEILEFNSNIILVKSELATINNLIISSFDQFSKNQHAFGEQLKYKTENVNNGISVLKKAIELGNDLLKEQSNANWESIMLINRNATKMFYIMLTLSIINSIGLLSILYMIIKFLV